MKRIIIGIHGLSNKPPQKTLKRWWSEAIREGLIRIGKERWSVPFELVYWADLLYPEPLDPKAAEKEHPLYLKEPFTEEHLEKPPERASIRIKMMAYVATQLDKIFLNNNMTIKHKGITDQIIRRFAQDLALYYNDEPASLFDPACTVKKVIQYRLIEKLRAHRRCKILLIAHSMGSIVAFDVLWPRKRNQPVHRLITIGSPLGLPVITARIFADQKAVDESIDKPHAPDCVTEQWLNMSDIGDKVALDHTLADDYAPNSKGLSAQDIFVFNDYVRNGKANAHKSYGYLRTPEMAAAIDDFLPDRLRDKVFRVFKKRRIKRIEHNREPDITI